MMYKKFLLITIFIHYTIYAVFADKLHLKNGEVYEGNITEGVDGKVWIEVDSGMKLGFGKDEIEKIEKTEEMGFQEEKKPSPSRTEEKETSISYYQIMRYLENFFTMEKSTPIDGEDRYMGQTSDKLAILEIVGDKDNISQTSLVIGIPNDSPDIVMRNSAIALRFLKNTVPECLDWFNSVLKSLENSNKDCEETVRGNKIVSVTRFRNLGGIGITIKRR